MKPLKLFVGLVALSLLPSAGLAGRSGGGEEPSPLLEARFVTSGPVIDGDPTDTVWEQSVPESTFRILGQPSAISSLTSIKALYDDTALYFLFTCRGKSTDELVASTIRRDGPIWDGDDEVEIFLFAGGQDTTYTQFISNPIGAKFDYQSVKYNVYKDFLWNVAPGWTESAWVAEVEIPLHQFVQSIEEGETWRANFARYLRVEPDSTLRLTWGATMESFHERENFGRIRFEEAVTVKETSLEIDWTSDESLAISNLRKLKGEAIYRPLKDYFDVTLTLRHSNRPYEVLSRRVIDFIREFPDSSASLDLALRTVYPAATNYRVPPEVVDAFAKEVASALELKGIEQDLLSLSRGLYDNLSDRREAWMATNREMAAKDQLMAATATCLLLSRTAFDIRTSTEDEILLKEALRKFSDLVIDSPTPLFIQEGANWLISTPTRGDIDDRVYEALKRTARFIPEEVLALTRSKQGIPDIPDDLSLSLRKIEFELYASRRSPFSSPQKADSLILSIIPYDEDYGQTNLYALLRDKVRELDQEYVSMGRDSLPSAIRNAVRLRRQYKDNHPIDMVFALAYEAIDSLDKSVEYIDRYMDLLGEEWQKSGPSARFSQELHFRRDHRDDPDFFTIPRNPFRLVYRITGFKSSPSILDISSEGRAVIYPNVPDSLDPRERLLTTVEARGDSPAIAFQLSREEINSLYALVSRYDFMRFKLKYTEPCYECGSNEITLYTPWNMRTIYLVGEDLTKPVFQFRKAVSSILDKYLRNVFYRYPTRSERAALYGLWGEYNSPDEKMGKRLDILLELFEAETRQWAWEKEGWYIAPLIELGEVTGREAEVSAAIGLKYFNTAFRWNQYWRERVPKSETKAIVRAREHLREASRRSRRERDQEWYTFLADFTLNYERDIGKIAEELETLQDRTNHENARSLLLWLACARNRPDVASTQYTALVDSRAPAMTKYRATLRMMLFNKDHKRHEEALSQTARIEEEYGKFLRKGRDTPIRELDEYTRIDLTLDRIDLLFRLGENEAATALVEEIDADEVPLSRGHEYDDFVRLSKLGGLPLEYREEEIRDYVRTISALNRSQKFELSARWAMWMLENPLKDDLRPQIISTLMSNFQRRDVWDDLEAEIAQAVLAEYRKEIEWRGIDPAMPILDVVIARGDLEDVVELWREEILPDPLERSRVVAMERLVTYFTRKNELEEAHLAIDKIRRELPRKGPDPLLATLIATKYTLDQARLEVTELDRHEEGIALIDSLAGALRQLSADAYPFVFIAIADWKERYQSWDTLVEFVSPHGDSLIEVEEDLTWSIFRPPLLPDTPILSPLLALRCIQRDRPPGSRDDFFELLGIELEAADEELKALSHGVHKLNLECHQAQLLYWKEKNFRGILDEYARRGSR